MHLDNVNFIEGERFCDLVIQEERNPRAFCFSFDWIKIFFYIFFHDCSSFHSGAKQPPPQNEVVVVQSFVAEVQLGGDLRRNVNVVRDRQAGELSSWEKVIGVDGLNDFNANRLSHVSFHHNWLGDFITYFWWKANAHSHVEPFPLFWCKLRQVGQSRINVVNFTSSWGGQTAVRIWVRTWVDYHPSQLGC